MKAAEQGVVVIAEIGSNASTLVSAGASTAPIAASEVAAGTGFTAATANTVAAIATVTIVAAALAGTAAAANAPRHFGVTGVMVLTKGPADMAPRIEAGPVFGLGK